MYATADQIKKGNTVQIAAGGEIIEVVVKSLKVKSGVVRINDEYALAASQSVFIRYQLTAAMREPGVRPCSVVKLANGTYWRGNTSAPVKTRNSAGLLTRKEARALCDANQGARIEDAPKSRNV